MKPSSKQLFIRQTTLTEIGESGQQKLQQTSVVIVGCGGLGNTVATSLAGSGIGTIHLVDFDLVDVSNLHRQLFFTLKDIGKPKVEILGNYLRKMAPFTKVLEHNLTINKKNVFELINDIDYVLDCTDSLPTKYLLNDACVLQNKPLIYGSLYKFDGYVASFNILRKADVFSTNLRDAFPEMSKESIPNCSEIGTLNTIVGIIGLIQANEVLKLVCGIGNSLIDKLLIYNSLENSQHKMKLNKTFDKDRIQHIFDKESYIDSNCEAQDEALLITANELRKILSEINPKLETRNPKLKIISVIEDISTPLPFQVDAKIPLSKLDDIVGHIERPELFGSDANKKAKFILICQKGISSYEATEKIKEKFPDLEVLSLQGGISNF